MELANAIATINNQLRVVRQLICQATGLTQVELRSGMFPASKCCGPIAEIGPSGNVIIEDEEPPVFKLQFERIHNTRGKVIVETHKGVKSFPTDFFPTEDSIYLLNSLEKDRAKKRKVYA
jgi:hypothetical protein